MTHLTTHELVEYIAQFEGQIAELANEINDCVKSKNYGAIQEKTTSLNNAIKTLNDLNRALEAKDEGNELDGKLDHVDPVIAKFLQDYLNLNIGWLKEMKATTNVERRELVKEGKLTKTDYGFLQNSLEDCKKAMVNDVVARSHKLKQQLEKKGGAVISCELMPSPTGFNGLVVCENNTLWIETIIAGGYNIQKAHYRTLVKVYKK